MFWFDKSHKDVLFVDNRRETHTLKDKSSKGGTRRCEIKPDLIADFRSLPFVAGAFSLVVFDPPHLRNNGSSGWLTKKYGKLGKNWQNDLRAGFVECFRVLRAKGVLVFKWNEHEIPVSKILALCPVQPLFGHKSGKQSKTHWLVFMKRDAP
jgi:hypothetical protein